MKSVKVLNDTFLMDVSPEGVQLKTEQSNRFHFVPWPVIFVVLLLGLLGGSVSTSIHYEVQNEK